ncbi:YncE family protein [Actinoplanes sp. ATCC 53533]|uniref:YncE family protein n=1 Tax=Actinoplanes sp. ATCC 53533 TaxID=1288362 RepID=UPI001F2EB389|nr:YncE family protein [Actinoplanes sp. ATCC 53533]
MPTQVLTEIDSSVRETRLKGVGELERLANGTDLAMAAAARHTLMRLTQEDSRSVAAAAAAALERTTVRLVPDQIHFGQVSAGTPRLLAEVLVEGPPLAVAAAVTVSGPGLRAVLAGRRLRIAWLPASDWLDGTVTVRGPAGWADVRVTGQVAATLPPSQVEIEELAAVDDLGATRMTVLSAPAKRRQARGTVLLAALAAGVLLGGAGVAVALNRGEQPDPAPVVAFGPLPSTAPATTPTTAAAPAPAGIVRVPLAQGVASVAKPAVVGTIRVGAEPEGVMVSPDSRTVYVANQNSRILSVVDAASRRVTTIRMRNTPRFVATSRDGRLVFVSMYEKDMSGSGVAVVDAASRKVLRHLSTGVQPFTLAVGPDGRIWVPIHSAGRVEIYSADGHRAGGRVKVPPNPHAVAFSERLGRAYTANHESNAVSIIDTRTDRLVKSVPVSKSPHSIAVSPDGRRVLVAGYDANTADLLDAANGRRTGPFRVGKQPQSVAFAPDGEHAYVVNEGDDSVSVLNGRTGAVTATVRVGGSPRTISVSPDGRLAYVTNGADNTISMLRISAQAGDRGQR